MSLSLQAGLHALRHCLEQLVAGGVAERIVDALEMVEIEIKHCELFAAADQRKFLLEPFAQQHPVGQIGQRIVMRKMGDALLGILALGHVLDDAEQILRLAVVVPDREPAREDRAQPSRRGVRSGARRNTGLLDSTSSSSRAVIRSASAFENTS